jgi:hypothetical protein
VIFTKSALLLAYPARPSIISIADAYPNKDPPPSIAALKESRVQRPKIGRHYAQKDDNKIFLVPLT